jgi:very-short-patch-repair endonuclease
MYKKIYNPENYYNGSACYFFLSGIIRIFVGYKNYKTEVIITCPKHGDFPQTPASHLKGCGCRKCNKNIGENAIRNFLTKNNIEFEEQKRFKDCKNIKPLPFDFYLPQYNLCIEFDGKQHFIPTDFKSNLTEEEKLKSFELLQIRDNIKTDYCKNNNINLLRIKYTENIEEKLIKYFKNHES